MKLSDIRKLCTPAYVYLVISAIGLIFLIFQNASNTTSFCAGDYECAVPSTAGLFIIKGIYIVFWTFILNSVCKGGGKHGRAISWFLVLVPIILMAIAMGLLFVKDDSPPQTMYTM